MKKILCVMLTCFILLGMAPLNVISAESNSETAVKMDSPVKSAKEHENEESEDEDSDDEDSEETEPEETEPEETETEETEPEETEPEETEPEETEPEETEPEETEPEETEPGETEPEETEPGETEPEQTEPEETEPEETEPGETEPKETEPGETEPEETEPGETEPEETEPEETEPVHPAPVIPVPPIQAPEETEPETTEETEPEITESRETLPDPSEPGKKENRRKGLPYMPSDKPVRMEGHNLASEDGEPGLYAEISLDFLKKFCEAAGEDGREEGITFGCGPVSVTYDLKALNAIVEQAEGADTLAVSVEKRDEQSRRLTKDQQEILTSCPRAKLYSISLKAAHAGSCWEIHDFKDGNSAIEVPYYRDAGFRVRAFRVGSAGTLTRVPCSYDSESGQARFETSSHSHYILMPERTDFLLCWIAAGVLLILLVCVMIWNRKGYLYIF